MDKRYPALRLIAGVYKVLGVVTGILTLISVVATPMAYAAVAGMLTNDIRGGGMGMLYGLIFAACLLATGAIATVSLYALGEGILLALAVEENTRGAALLMQQQLSGSLSAGSS